MTEFQVWDVSPAFWAFGCKSCAIQSSKRSHLLICLSEKKCWVGYWNALFSFVFNYRKFNEINDEWVSVRAFGNKKVSSVGPFKRKEKNDRMRNVWSMFQSYSWMHDRICFSWCLIQILFLCLAKAKQPRYFKFRKFKFNLEDKSIRFAEMGD